MKPKLFFGVSLGFDLTTNEQLKNMAALSYWDAGLQKRLYVFPATELDRVIALTGKVFDFGEQKAELINLMHHAPGLKEEIEQNRWKGEGYVLVQEFPKIFIVTTVIRKKPAKFQIPIETVQDAWRAAKTLQKGKTARSKDLAEKWCRGLGITRFHRATGSWDGDKLYGSRKEYFLWYYGLKVLEHYGLISYSKSGLVVRL